MLEWAKIITGADTAQPSLVPDVAQEKDALVQVQVNTHARGLTLYLKQILPQLCATLKAYAGTVNRVCALTRALFALQIKKKIAYLSVLKAIVIMRFIHARKDPIASLIVWEAGKDLNMT